MQINIRLGSLSAAIISAVVIIFAGCSLFNGNSTQQQKADEVYRLTRIAANTGTTADLAFRPQDKPAFEKAYSVLDNAILLTNLNGATLHQVFTNLPIKELKDPRAKILVDNALFLFDEVTGGGINLETNAVYVFAAGRGLHDGIGSSLGKNVSEP